MNKKHMLGAIALVALAATLGGCGYSSVDNELIGQPKKLFHQTPIVCSDRTDVDISLGVMRNGVGSMSTQDLFLTVNKQSDIDMLNKAIADGKLVKVHYNQYRITFCQNEDSITSVEVMP